MDFISSKEREIAYTTAQNATIMGWDKAVGQAASKYRVTQHDVEAILDRAARQNKDATGASRIDELDDWVKEQRGRSERASGSRLHRLSPGLRAYMEAKAKGDHASDPKDRIAPIS